MGILQVLKKNNLKSFQICQHIIIIKKKFSDTESLKRIAMQWLTETTVLNKIILEKNPTVAAKDTWIKGDWIGEVCSYCSHLFKTK